MQHFKIVQLFLSPSNVKIELCPLMIIEFPVLYEQIHFKITYVRRVENIKR